MAARRCALRHIGHYLPAPVLPVRPALLEVLEHVAVDSQGDEPFAFGIAGGGAGRFIPSPDDQDRYVQWRRPTDMMVHG